MNQNTLNLSSILFLDIETVPQYPSFEDCPDELKALWSRKAEKLPRSRAEELQSQPTASENGTLRLTHLDKLGATQGDALQGVATTALPPTAQPPTALPPTAALPTANLPTADSPTADSLYPRAGIYAEFGKIICISVGYLVQEGTAHHLRKKSFYGDDERVLLEEFAELLNKHFSKPDSRLCAHNGKEFDFPWLSRRMIINNIPLPAILDTAGRKPWEVNHLDTMEMWKFGDYKSYTPLNLLTYILGIPSPKDDIDGSQVYSVYYHERDLPRIVKYCEKDVEALVKVFLRLKGVGVV